MTQLEINDRGEVAVYLDHPCCDGATHHMCTVGWARPASTAGARVTGAVSVWSQGESEQRERVIESAIKACTSWCATWVRDVSAAGRARAKLCRELGMSIDASDSDMLRRVKWLVSEAGTQPIANAVDNAEHNPDALITKIKSLGATRVDLCVDRDTRPPTLWVSVDDDVDIRAVIEIVRREGPSGWIFRFEQLPEGLVGAC